MIAWWQHLHKIENEAFGSISLLEMVPMSSLSVLRNESFWHHLHRSCECIFSIKKMSIHWSEVMLFIRDVSTCSHSRVSFPCSSSPRLLALSSSTYAPLPDRRRHRWRWWCKMNEKSRPSNKILSAMRSSCITALSSERLSSRESGWTQKSISIHSVYRSSIISSSMHLAQPRAVSLPSMIRRTDSGHWKI